MGRKRKSLKHLPRYMYFKSGSYYFYAPGEKWILLSMVYSEALAKYAKLIGDRLNRSSNSDVMGNIIDRYMVEVSPQKSQKTHKNEMSSVKYLKTVFAETRINEIKAVHIYRYLDVRGEKAKTSANREISLLSHIFTMAIRWGLAEFNPCLNIRKHPEAMRDRYVTDKELVAVKSIAPPMMQNIISFAYQTGLRMSDILNIKLSDIQDDGIYLTIRKTKIKARILIDDDLAELIEKTKRDRYCASFYLFHTRQGKAYTSDGFSSNWQKIRNRALELGIITESFQFKDFRHKSATEADRLYGREHARQLLAHTSDKVTRNYIAGRVDIKPMKKISNI